MPHKPDLVLKQGERDDITFSVSDESGGGFDLTDFDVELKAVRENTEIHKTEDDDLTVTAPTEGEFVALFTSEDTKTPGRYHLECRIFGADRIRTILDQALVIEESVYG